MMNDAYDEKDARISELEAAIAEALKPRIANQHWYTGYDYIDLDPLDMVDDGKHPDVREYESMKRRLDRAHSKMRKAMSNFDRCADILDKAVLCLVVNECDDRGVVDDYTSFMQEIKGTLS